MENPFEDASGIFLVVRNDEMQYSLWPNFLDIPKGWDPVYGPVGRSECLDFIEANWTDMRPLSLVRRMDSGAAE